MTESDTAVLTRMRDDLVVDRAAINQKLDAIDILLGRDVEPIELHPAIEVTTPAPADPPKPKRAKKAAKKKRPRNNNIDWLTVRDEYENGAAVADLAKRHKCSQSPINRRIRSEGWTRRDMPTSPSKTAAAGFCPTCRRELIDGTCQHCGYRG